MILIDLSNLSQTDIHKKAQEISSVIKAQSGNRIDILIKSFDMEIIKFLYNLSYLDFTVEINVLVKEDCRQEQYDKSIILTADADPSNEASASTSIDKQSTKDPLKNKYENVVNGGTFDYLHPGHKLLLSQSCHLCNSRIIVGVSELPPEKLAKKKFAGEMQALEERIEGVKHFIQLYKPSLKSLVIGILRECL